MPTAEPKKFEELDKIVDLVSKATKWKNGFNVMWLVSTHHHHHHHYPDLRRPIKPSPSFSATVMHMVHDIVIDGKSHWRLRLITIATMETKEKRPQNVSEKKNFIKSSSRFLNAAKKVYFEVTGCGKVEVISKLFNGFCVAEYRCIFNIYLYIHIYAVICAKFGSWSN